MKMNLNGVKCFLECLNRSHKPILLKHGTTIALGRSLETKVKDRRCSKHQVEMTANYELLHVHLKQIGPNEGCAQSKIIKQGEELNLSHHEIYEFLDGKYPHKIVFYPEPITSGNKGEANGNNFLSTTNGENTQSIPNKAQKRVRSPSPNVIAKTSNNIENSLSENVWETCCNGNILVFNRGSAANTKIAAYDMDGTLICTSSGKVFPRDMHDWKILYPEVPQKLKDLYHDGFKIVIFSNQAGISSGKTSARDIQEKIKRIISKIGVSAQALVSTGKGRYRKPMIGMWDFFIKQCNASLKVDLSESFYVGDAAGRSHQISAKKVKKDHSNADRLFAMNLNLTFLTPEEHFLGKKPSNFSMPDFIPNDIAVKDLYDPVSTVVPSCTSTLEVILMVGPPGCGKSTFVENNLKEYVPANRDSVGSWQKCVALMQSSLKSGKKVVIDNTNPDRESRKRYIDAAKNFNARIRCFIFNVSLDHARHNNKFRELTNSAHSKISDMIFNMYKSKFEEPKLSEGIYDIVKVNFVPKFNDEESEKLYKMFLLEK